MRWNTGRLSRVKISKVPHLSHSRHRQAAGLRVTSPASQGETLPKNSPTLSQQLRSWSVPNRGTATLIKPGARPGRPSRAPTKPRKRSPCPPGANACTCRAPSFARCRYAKSIPPSLTLPTAAARPPVARPAAGVPRAAPTSAPRIPVIRGTLSRTLLSVRPTHRGSNPQFFPARNEGRVYAKRMNLANKIVNTSPAG
jgi:hypothetical protein